MGMITARNETQNYRGTTEQNLSDAPRKYDNMEHELVLLSEKINWKGFEKKFGEIYIQDVGRSGLPTRLMVGLHYLKGMYDLSDEAVVEGFLENPYWQYL